LYFNSIKLGQLTQSHQLKSSKMSQLINLEPERPLNSKKPVEDSSLITPAAGGATATVANNRTASSLSSSYNCIYNSGKTLMTTTSFNSPPTTSALTASFANGIQIQQTSIDETPHKIVYKKIENIIEKMQDDSSGVPIRTVKSFMSKIPSVFTGSDLIQWMHKKLDVEDTCEALHFAHLIASHGYMFPIDDHILTVKNDGTFFRFQVKTILTVFEIKKKSSNLYLQIY
jgi:hypothetical protein